MNYHWCLLRNIWDVKYVVSFINTHRYLQASMTMERDTDNQKLSILILNWLLEIVHLYFYDYIWIRKLFIKLLMELDHGQVWQGEMDSKLVK